MTEQKAKRSGLTYAKEKMFGLIMWSSTTAEKSGKGMALKICTGAKPFLKAYIKPFDNTETRMLPIGAWPRHLRTC